MGMSSKQVCIKSDHLELNWAQNMMSFPSSDDHRTTIIQSSSSSNPRPSTTNIKQQQAAAADSSLLLKCPRCDSSNTKFCYYNNYNKAQPRHYCKACKRHWTKGGTLRNVPVGGGRKNKRTKRPHAAAAAPPITTSLLSTATISSDHNININLGFDDHQTKYIFPTQQLEEVDINTNKGGGGLLFKLPIHGRHWDFNGGGFAASSTGMQQQSSKYNQSLGSGFSISLTSSMDTNSIIPTSSANCYSPLLPATGGFKDDDSSTTRMMSTPNSSNVVVSSSQPWIVVPTPASSNTNNILEPNNFWTWNDIDYMVQGDHHINN